LKIRGCVDFERVQIGRWPVVIAIGIRDCGGSTGALPLTLPLTLLYSALSISVSIFGINACRNPNYVDILRQIAIR